MARNIANVEILTDTFNAWMLRTNEVIDVIRTEVLTANSTLGVTGTVGAPRNARLWGAFTANNLNADALALGSNFVANSSAVLFGPVRVIAGGTNGTVGQVLTSTGSGVQWATAPGTGTVTNITSGNGISSFIGGSATNAITSTGTITVKPGTGIVVDTGGVSVNTAYLNTVVNPQTLQGYTWASPAAIGTGVANTGKFTTVTANAGPSGGYLIEGDSVFKLTNSEFLTPGFIDATTPVSGGGVRVRTNASGVALISITNSLGGELNNFRHSANGELTYSNNFVIAGTARYGAGPHNDTEIGYKTIPQIVTNTDITINPTQSSGAHHYKTATTGVYITFPANASAPCPVGTAITFVNDAEEGSIVLIQAASVVLQLGGSLVTGDREIVPGGVATALKVATNKWIVSGSGVA